MYSPSSSNIRKSKDAIKHADKGEKRHGKEWFHTALEPTIAVH